MVQYNIQSGEDKAWRELSEADPEAVAKRSLAGYLPESGNYVLDIFGEPYLADPAARKVTNLREPGKRIEYLLGLSVPVYLSQAKELPPSGELVKELRGGDFFFRGSHVLPLDAVADKYGKDRELFIEAGRALGGYPAERIGDAAFRFRVFPRVEMAFVLWLEDDEFPARASLLFDSNADRQMALDVVWAVALVACQRMIAFH
ncbi:MAG TPA: DUF3786 domain-containing protein [Nitrospirota bacterium]|nr:DUF3786 domain-containing protein [Nitrospirota bacterium]